MNIWIDEFWRYFFHGKYWSSAGTWDNSQLDEVLDDCLVNPIPSTIPNIEVYELGYAPNNGIYVKWSQVMVGQWDGRSTVSPPAVFAATLPAHCNTGLARTSIKCRKMTNPTCVNMGKSCAHTYAQIHGVVTCIWITYNTTCIYKYNYMCVYI